MKITNVPTVPKDFRKPYLAMKRGTTNMYLVTNDGAVNLDENSTGYLVKFTSVFKLDDLIPVRGAVTIQNTTLE